ncbi:molybdopterin molybdenumtransferase [Caldalkalibacillus thermarum]|uniref:molybdopterin molybdotransferase MoeA n=1 Tax=Caldalkalibacillus thermarum TaxID=296745 RepID=UPI00166CB61F|nr:gephyrin-like molybdotransferase Glp [Caldalkalibacillus thermarum]GGK20525.1 molybdopterin molybdenumtransferase [Caldalkalibacillus thermarum]
MKTDRKPVTIEEAIERIVSRSSPGKAITVSLEKADFLHLAEDIVADHHVPMFDRSMYDGFAVKAADTQQAEPDAPKRLRVIESIPAGKEAQGPLQSGTAMRIMTGAAIPPGADAVLMLEDVREGNDKDGSYIEVTSPVSPGSHISHRGEDITAGMVLAKTGRRIGPGEKAVLATFGYHQVKVYQPPEVAILATGSELLPVDAPLVPGKIRNSNSYMVETQLRRMGAVPKPLGIIKDDFEACYQAVATALEEADFVVTTGGASVGDYDFVQALIERLDAEVLFNKVAMRPGSVTTVAKKGEKWLFGLSGNPAACFVGVELFVRPVLKKAMGAQHIHLPQISATLAVDITTTNPYTRLMRARTELHQGQMVVRPVGLDKSSIISGLLEANSLLMIPGGEQTYHRGEKVNVIWLEEEGMCHGSTARS